MMMRRCLRDLMYYAAHRYYHWRSGRGWRCQECRKGRCSFCGGPHAKYLAEDAYPMCQRCMDDIRDPYARLI